jgi:hypothetical protein
VRLVFLISTGDGGASLSGKDGGGCGSTIFGHTNARAIFGFASPLHITKQKQQSRAMDGSS